MILVCTQPYGNFTPGDEMDVPDNALYDGAHFAEKPKETPAARNGGTQESEQ